MKRLKSKKRSIFGVFILFTMLLAMGTYSFAETEVNIESFNSALFPFIYANVNVKWDGSPVSDLTAADFQIFESADLQTDYFEVTPPETGAEGSCLN